MDLNENATFTCETKHDDYTVWKVNGSSDLSEISDDVESDQKHNLFILSITAKAVYNGTTLQCVTGEFEGVPVESANVTLTIRGIIHVARCTYMYMCVPCVYM